MKKYIFLGIAILIIVFSGIFLWLKSKHTPDIYSIDTSTFEPFGPSGGSATGGITDGGWSATSGSSSVVSSTSTASFDIEKLKKQSTMYGEGNYEVVSNEKYDITFWEPDQTFNITIKEKPVGYSRRLAEDKLIEILGIPKEKICSLNVLVGAPFSLDTDGPEGYGLSFCPGSVVLPEMEK